MPVLASGPPAPASRRSLAWRSVVPPGQVGRAVQLSVTPANGVTRIRLEEQLNGVAGAYFGEVVRQRLDGRERLARFATLTALRAEPWTNIQLFSR